MLSLQSNGLAGREVGGGEDREKDLKPFLTCALSCKQSSIGWTQLEPRDNEALNSP